MAMQETECGGLLINLGEAHTPRETWRRQEAGEGLQACA